MVRILKSCEFGDLTLNRNDLIRLEPEEAREAVFNGLATRELSGRRIPKRPLSMKMS